MAPIRRTNIKQRVWVGVWVCGGEAEKPPERPVERDVHRQKVFRGPGDELSGIGRFCHRADGSYQSGGVLNPLMAEDGRRLDEVGPGEARLSGLRGVEIKCESQDCDTPIRPDWNDCRDPARAVDGKGGGRTGEAQARRPKFGGGDSEVKQKGKCRHNVCFVLQTLQGGGERDKIIRITEIGDRRGGITSRRHPEVERGVRQSQGAKCNVEKSRPGMWAGDIPLRSAPLPDESTGEVRGDRRTESLVPGLTPGRQHP